MLKKCTLVMSAMPSKLLLTQKAFSRPLAYRFAFFAENTSKNSSLVKESIDENIFNLKNFSFSTIQVVSKVKHSDNLVVIKGKRLLE